MLEKTNQQPSFFYGWVIVAVAVVTGTMVYGVRYSFSVFFPEILAEFGWSRGSTALMVSINFLIYGMAAPVSGTIAGRWKPRILMRAGVALLALALAGCFFANHLWQFYLFFGVLVPLGSAMSAWPIFSPALMNWFPVKRGLVMGIGNTGGSLCFLYGLLAQFLILFLGWRYAYLALAVSVAAILLPLHYFLFHYRPETKGLQPYGHDGPVAGEAPAGMDLHSDWTLRRMLSTRQLWLLVLCHFLFWGVAGSLVLAHQIKYIGDVGYSALFAASILGVFGVSMFLGQASGFISDGIGREKTMALCSVTALAGLFALFAVRDDSQPWLLYVHAVLFGYGGGLYTSIINAGAADIFHGRNYGTASGLLLAGMGFGGAVGPWLGGYLYDSLGSYDVPFMLCMACIVFASVCFWLAAPRNANRLRAQRLKGGAGSSPF